MRTGNIQRLLLPALFFLTHGLAAQQTTPASASPQWDSVKPAGNGLSIAYKNGTAFLLSPTGQRINDQAYEAVRPFAGNRAAVKKDGRWGFVNKAGEEVIAPHYTSVNDFSAGRALACEGDACRLLDEGGNTVLPARRKSPPAESRRAQKAHEYAELLSVFGNGRTASAIPCPTNIDFETGTFASWQTNVGTTSTANGTTNVITLPAAGWAANAGTLDRHTLQDRTNAVPSIDKYGVFPVNPVNGGRYSLKLGGDNNLGVCGSAPCPNARAEAARYVINVPTNATNYSITFSYAVVLENPLANTNLHKDFEQPRFTVKMYDPTTNEVIPCANFTFVASGPLPGFDTSDIVKSPDAVVRTKEWSSVYVNLSKHGGKTFYLEFTTADCTKGGHFGYAYVDVIECGIAAKSQTRCAPVNTTTLYGPPGFQGYQWYTANFGALVGNTQNVVLNPAPPVGTQYWVVATPYPNTGCPTCDCRDTVKVEVMPNFPDANAGPDRAFCPGTTASIGARTVPGLTYQWSPVTGLADAAAATTLTTGAASQYVLRVTDTFGCSVTDTVDVRLQPKPSPSFTPNSTAQCVAGNKFTFSNASTVTAGALTYAWKFGDGTTSTQKEPAHSYTAPGTYRVVLTVASADGCLDSTEQLLTVHPMPVLALAGNGNYTVCRGAGVQLQVSGADSYVWSPAQGLSCTSCPSPVASPVTSARYFVEGMSAAGCRAADSVGIAVIQPFDIATAGDTLCAGDTVQLSARGADRYTWSPATGLNSTTVATPLANPAQTITYTVVGHDNQGCFTDTAFATVTVAPVPTVNLGADLTLSTGSTVTLQGTVTNGPITGWLWWPRSLLTCYTCPSPTADVRTDVVYRVQVTNTFGCTATDSLVIKTVCAEGQVFIPNAFTPDGDGVNDVFFVQGRGISVVKTLRIFNRWGELLFERLNVSPNDVRVGWDGKVRGVAGPPDVFVYTAEVVCSNGRVFFFKGNVSVLK